jgi:hypothetical protein
MFVAAEDSDEQHGRLDGQHPAQDTAAGCPAGWVCAVGRFPADGVLPLVQSVDGGALPARTGYARDHAWLDPPVQSHS